MSLLMVDASAQLENNVPAGNLPVATNAAIGAVKPDTTSITVAGDGTLSAHGTGITAVIVTAALTPTGTQGSMTFTKGLLTAQTPAT